MQSNNNSRKITGKMYYSHSQEIVSHIWNNYEHVFPDNKFYQISY